LENKSRIEIDTLTLIAISVIAWSLANFLHEAIGHAGSAAFLGIPVRAVSTTTMFIEWSQINSAAENMIIHAAGAAMNLLTGIIALLFLRSNKVTNSSTRYFLWLFSTISFIIVIMNLISAPLFGGGDFSVIIQETENRQLWKGIIVGAGVTLTIPGYALPLRYWLPDMRGHRKTLLKITIIPVLTLIIVQSLSLIGSPFSRLPPEYNHLLASVFAYVHFVLWVILVNILPVPRSTRPIESIRLPRSIMYLSIGLIVGIFFIVVLGPGWGPLEQDPRLGYWK
jgi:hypothetical protein